LAGSAQSIVSKITSLLVVDPNGYELFNPLPGTTDITEAVKSVNGATNVASSFYGEHWSDSLIQSLGENVLLYENYSGASLGTTFPSDKFGMQMAAISKLMLTKDDRGMDRDFFFAELTNWDMHSNIALPLEGEFQQINDGLKAFKEEMVYQEKWEDVTVVFVSEFARTLMANTGNGR